MARHLSNEQRALAMRLSERGLSHREIADVIGCSKGNIGKIVNPAARARYNEHDRNTKRAWTDEEINRACELRNMGWGSTAIARELNRTVSSIESQLHFRRDDGTRIAVHNAGGPVEVPDYVWAERDARLSRAPRSLTALLMGDPV